MAAIICLGIAVRDMVFTVPALPLRAQKIRAAAFDLHGGGMAATAAVAAAALGGSVDYWGRLGDDDSGRELQRELDSRGVRVRAHPTCGTRTPTSAVLVADDGERMLAVFAGELDDDADWLPLADVTTVQAVLADLRWPQGARALYAAATAARIPRVLDADVGDPAAVRSLLPLVDHAVFSRAGLAELTGRDDPEGGLRAAAAITPGVAAVTLGEQGSLFFAGGAVHHVPAPAIVARDTNGAGDVFHGAYTLALAEGRGVLDAARFATVAAALKCRGGIGWGAVPARASVDNFLRGALP